MCASDGEISVPVSARHYFALSGGCVWPERLCRLRCWFWTEGGWIFIDDCRNFVAKWMLIVLSGVRFILHTYFGSYNMLIGRHGISPQVRHFAVCSVCIGARGWARPVRARFSPWLSAPCDEAAVRGRPRYEVGRREVGRRESAAVRGRPRCEVGRWEKGVETLTAVTNQLIIQLFSQRRGLDVREQLSLEL